jgi:hypothetical protein
MAHISIRTEVGFEVAEIPSNIATEASHLVENTDRYFEPNIGAFTAEVTVLVQDRVRWDGVKRAIGLMRDAYDGRIARRDPLTVRPIPGERLLVLDGNSTLTVAIAAGWRTVLCQMASPEA